MNTSEGLPALAALVGYGFPNTDEMIAKYADNDTYCWKFIKEKRDNTGLDWFMPSRYELNLMYNNRTVITEQGGDPFSSSSLYWSSTDSNDNLAWARSFNTDKQGEYTKDSTVYCRLLRRI